MITVFVRETRTGYYAVSQDWKHSARTRNGVVATIKACASKALGVPASRLTAEPEKPGQFTEIPVGCWWTVKEITR